MTLRKELFGLLNFMAAMACLLGGFEAPAASAEPRGRDPLSLQEAARAESLAASSPSVTTSLKAHGGHSLLRPGLVNVQYLYSQSRLEAGDTSSSARRADVYFYDYVNDQAYQMTVNLTTGVIQSSLVMSGILHQPMVAPAETEAVFQILLAHPKFGPALRKIYGQHHKDTLLMGAQMAAQAGIFFPSSKIGTPLEKVTATCATHRCLQIFLHATDEELLDTNNLVVDLSSGEVLWR